MTPCSSCARSCTETDRFCAGCGAALEGVAPTSMRSDKMIGRTLPGGYVVQHLAGIGGMGRVYLAEQTTLARTVAVKVIHPHFAFDESTAARFITEARAASRLNHPNSIAIFDFGTTDDGQLYLVMEYLRGKDLAYTIEHEPPFTFHRIGDILRQTLAALEEAHQLGIIHRDLKPENIVLEQMRSGRDFVKVFDYGLAKILDAAASGDEAGGPRSRGAPLTVPGFVCGTPEYMSPEQARGDACDGRADLYSAGVILYQLLACRLPFDADSSTRLLLMHLNDAPADPRVVAPERRIPDALAEVALRALEKDPAKRFESAHDLALAITEAISGSLGARAPTPAAGTLAHAAERVGCDACGADNDVAQKFCGDCGGPLSRPSGPRSNVIRKRSHAAIVEISDGRHGEALEWLEGHRETARAMPGHARIAGASGSGKTTLLGTFVERCTARGDFVAHTSASAGSSEISGFALRDMITQLAGGSTAEWTPSSSPLARAGLADLFTPPTGRPSSDDQTLATTPEDRRRAIAEALKWALRRAGERPGAALVVVAVDDLDEIDGVSRNAFVDMMREPPLVRSLLVMTYAIDKTHVPPAAFEEHVLGGHGARTDASDGSPMYQGELARWEHDPRTKGATAPRKLNAIINARIGQLSPEARWVLQAIAVLGDDCDAVTLQRAVPAHVDFAAALETLHASRFVVDTRVTHPLVRQIALAMAPMGVLGELHAAALDLRGDAAPLEVRAYHASYAALCGSTAADSSDDGRSRTFEALLMLDRVGAMRAARGDVDGSIAVLRSALDLARREMFRGELEDPVSAILLFSRKLGDALCASGAHEGAEGVLREALDLSAPNDTDRAQLLASLARVAHARARAQEAHGYLQEALRLAQRSDARELVVSLESFKKSIAV